MRFVAVHFSFFSRWVIIFPDKAKTIAQQFCKTWQQQGPRIGIEVANPIVKVRS